MPQVTKISPQKRKKGRLNIFIDSKFAFGLKEEIALEFGLKVGQNISDDEVNKILKKEEGAKLMDQTLHLLSFRQRSEKEVIDFLIKKIKVANDIDYKQAKESLLIDEILKKLKKYGYLNDLLFAKTFVESRARSRQKGKLALKMELSKKGISKEIVDSVLEGQDEDDLAKKALAKKIERFRKLEPLEFKKKVFSFLLTRGFTYEVAKKVFAFYKNKS